MKQPFNYSCFLMQSLIIAGQALLNGECPQGLVVGYLSIIVFSVLLSERVWACVCGHTHVGVLV